jgi:2-polyprenyl-3-methyl-5-hydroxy-6-metoxy-1,4-benzoquinol methylase
MKRYNSSLDLSDLNQSHSRLIQWVGSGKRVLDIGCGRGQIGRILNTQFGCTVTGLEINSEFARECVEYDRVVIGSAEEPAVFESFSKEFDVIICGDVLEHLQQPTIPLQASHRLLVPGGRLLISVPNVAQIRIRWMLLRGRWDYTPEGIMDATHLRWFTLRSLHALVAQCGWREQDFDFTVGPNLIRLLRRWRISKRWLSPSLLASQFLMNLSAE